MAHYPPDAPLSFAHLAALDAPPPELIDLLAGAGFASTSLRMRGTGGGSPEYPLRDAAERRRTRQRIEATGVAVLYIELVSFDRALRVPDLTAMFEIGAELGATRVLAAGDDDDFSLVAGKLAETAALGRRYGLAIDLEFMPFRRVRSFTDGLRVLELAGLPDNAHLCVDALHFYRSRSAIADLRKVAARLIGTFQICDGPRQPPADLTFEARSARLLPGTGELDLRALIGALPEGLPIGVEVPLASAYPQLRPDQRVALMADATRQFLSNSQ